MVRRHAVLIGLFLVSGASLLFEILLTKFFGSKLEHHFTFAVISMAMLGFGASGVYVHLRPKRFPTADGPSPEILGSYAWLFSLVCMLVVPVFCLLPIDPLFPGWRGAVALPLFFLMFALPFFFVGVCVSYTLIAARQGPGVVYFWDLLGAGIGAAVAAWSIRELTGFGSVVLVGVASLLGALVYWHGAGKSMRYWLTWRAPLCIVAALITLAYPSVGRKLLHGHEVFSIKYLELRQTLLDDFGGIELSYWNAVARIDVSKTGDSLRRTYRSSIAHRFDYLPIPGRFILVDGGASTRQFVIKGPLEEQEFLKNSLSAAPYIPRDPSAGFDRSLVIGAGGGVDVLVAKAFGTKQVDGIELNPDTFRLLVGRPDDPKRDLYAPSLRGGVRLMNYEARHYCHTLGESEKYDVIEATGVDTFTAIQSAANALSENFLYTEDAVGDYYRLLKPGGILSLSHGYSAPACITLRKFVTYLEFLEKQGVPEPHKSVVFLFDSYFENALLKKGEFTEEEIERLEVWTKINGYQFIYQPFLPDDAAPVRPFGDSFTTWTPEQYDLLARIQFAPFLDPGRPQLSSDDLPFVKLARAKNKAEREAVLDRLKWDVHPSTDERPYFYFIRPNHSSWVSAIDGAFIYPQKAVRWMFLIALVASLGLAIAPAFIRKGKEETPHARATVLKALPFFALCGFAFMLVENAAFLNLTMFVGGPLYSLSIVLPSILIGYSLGSLGTDRFLSGARARPLVVLAIYTVGFAAYWAAVKLGLPHLIGMHRIVRVILSVVLTVPLGAVLGVVVPWHMRSLKDQDPRSLAWMWAVSSAFNVIGSMSFVPVCFALGRSSTLVLATIMYLVAIAWAAATGRSPKASPA